jgi:hypothetical protein
VSGALTVSPASAQGAVNPYWTRGADVSAVLADQRYVLMMSPGQGSGPPAGDGRLLDEQTGRRVHVDPPGPGCSAVAVGGGWLMYDCYPSVPRVRLYRISTGRWQGLQPYPNLAPQAIGSRWVQLVAPSNRVNHALFQNIATGQERSLPAWAPGGSIIPDLNSPKLARRVCSPLRVPGAWSQQGTPEGTGQLSVFGQFLVVQGTSRPTQGDVWAIDYVSRCGSRTRTDLAWEEGTIGNRDAIMQAGGDQGIFLPSLHPFSINFQDFLTGQYGSSPDDFSTVLTARRIYLIAQDPSSIPECGSHAPTCPPPPTDYQLWYATAPKERHKQHRQ